MLTTIEHETINRWSYDLFTQARVAETENERHDSLHQTCLLSREWADCRGHRSFTIYLTRYFL